MQHCRNISNPPVPLQQSPGSSKGAEGSLAHGSCGLPHTFLVTHIFKGTHLHPGH